MDSAYNGGGNMDWSQINVGGAIRVADMSDKFASSATAITRTILIVGMHDTGYVDALDISDPNPAKVNQDGFRFLWENDGTHVVSPASRRCRWARPTARRSRRSRSRARPAWPS